MRPTIRIVSRYRARALSEPDADRGALLRECVAGERDTDTADDVG